MYSDVSEFVKTCEKCQLRKKKRYEEPLHPTWSTLVWEKVGVDVVYMPVTADGYGFIVFARDDPSGWVEARALKRNRALEVSTFLYEDVICRHGLPRKFVMDNGSENKDITKTLLENYNVKNVNISAYYPQSNGLVERGHASVVNALAKYCHDRQFQQWNAVLPLVLWADRVTVRRSTGYSGRDYLLPVDFTVVSWSLVDWDEELLMARMRQLDERELAEARAADELEMSGRINKDYFDQHKQLVWSLSEERRRRYDDAKMGRHSGHHYFVGYDKSDAIYSIWNPADDSITRARNVIFDETMYFQGETKDDPSSLTFNFTESPGQTTTGSEAPPLPTLPPISPVAESPSTSVSTVPPTPPTPPAEELPPLLFPPSRPPVISNYSLRSRGVPQEIESLLSFISTYPIPNTYRDAVKSPDFDKWKVAMDEEYSALMKPGPWCHRHRGPILSIHAGFASSERHYMD